MLGRNWLFLHMPHCVPRDGSSFASIEGSGRFDRILTKKLDHLTQLSSERPEQGGVVSMANPCSYY